MYQNSPNYFPYQYIQQQQQQQLQIPPGYIKGRPVVSFEEARAAQIDLDGGITVFTDIGNKRIYTKQLNMDGTASLHTYVLAEQPPTKKVQYITRQQFEQAISKLKEPPPKPIF